MTTLHPDRLGGLSVPEMAVWGMAHYLATGNWQQYGVMPPPGLPNCPCPEKINPSEMSALFGITEDHATSIWLRLLSAGAVTNE